MKKVILTTQGKSRAFMISGSETPFQILEHFDIDPATKTVFVNGSMLTLSSINKPITINGNVYISVIEKTIR